MKVQKRPNFLGKRCGGVELVYYIAVLALSLLAQELLKKKPKQPVQDDKPTTLTIRGSYITWVCGIKMVGPTFAWAGNRTKRKESTGGGKGGSPPKQDVWYESGWHQLSVGPCNALHKIVESGKVIFEGPITNTSHPSGTTVDLGKEGAFVIYWGEETQPINTFLGDASRLGISSRWPNVCYIQWTTKRLGSSAFWPKLDYELERRPTTSVVTGSSSWYEPTSVLSGVTKSIVAVNANIDPDIGFLQVSGDFTKQLDPGQPMLLNGNGIPNGSYIVRRATSLLVQTGVGFNGFPIYSLRTNVFLTTGTVGATVAGTIQSYLFSTDNGANIAHVIAELLFAPFPLGLDLEQGEPEPWDIPSLNALGVEAEGDFWRSGLVSVDGELAQGLLANALQDHGILLPFDLRTGAMLFNRVRKPVGTLPNLTTDLDSEDLPEIENYLGERKVDRMVYSFSDRDHGYGDMTIATDEDGQVKYTQYARVRVAGILSTSHFDTAAKLTELRSQEELAGVGVFKIRSSRECRTLIPGDAIVSDQFDEILRVVNVSFDALSEEVEIGVFPDFYGGRKSDFVQNPGGGNPLLKDAAANLEGVFVEIPEQLLSVERMFIQAPQIRAHDQISESIINLSRDDITYTLWGDELGFAAGGVLDVQLDIGSLSLLTQGPTFTVEGPDLGGVLDLSADPTNYGLGRQVVVIASTAGIEICYVKKITSLSGTQARLDGLSRARYDTRKVTHPVGAQVFIFENTSLEQIEDILLIPGEDLYLKAQPIAASGTIPLSSVPPFGNLLRGKGVVPVNPEAMHTRAPYVGSPTYRAADDVTVAWAWSSAFSKATGAGFQNAGTAIGAPSLKGLFIVELLTSANAVVSTQNLLVASVTYTAGQLAAAPISTTSFKVRVTHSYNGYLSDPITYSITKV